MSWLKKVSEGFGEGARETQHLMAGGGDHLIKGRCGLRRRDFPLDAYLF